MCILSPSSHTTNHRGGVRGGPMHAYMHTPPQGRGDLTFPSGGDAPRQPRIIYSPSQSSPRASQSSARAAQS